MGTYSKYIGQSYQTTSSELIILTATPSYEFTNNYIITDLLDNEDKLINPVNLRDMILSIWDSTVLKETSITSSNINYIGIDSGNPSDSDLKDRKIYFGKRDCKSVDIMDSTLLNSDVDIFFHNTRKDSISQQSTKVLFISGTNSTLHINSPYIESQIISSYMGSQSMSFDIINNSGDISVLSRGLDSFGQDTNDGGEVTINDIIFPTFQNSSASASNNKTLFYNNTGLIWDNIILDETDYIGVTGSELSIFGDPTYLNGYSLEFTESMKSPFEIGDIKFGSTFENESISNMLKRMIYTYLPPICSLSLVNTSGYFEIGTYPAVKLEYMINKRTNDTLPTLLTNMIPSSYAVISSNNHEVVTGIVDGIVISPIVNTEYSFFVRVNDGIQNNTASASVYGVYPYFYGFTSSSTLSTLGLKDFNKAIDRKSDKNYDLTGGDIFYFIYDDNYGPLSSIIDNLGNNIIASFSSSTQIFSSPTGLWASKQFKVYKWVGVSQIGPPSENYQFKY